jgi:predicted nucleotidyltransferase component of viral defense system
MKRDGQNPNLRAEVAQASIGGTATRSDYDKAVALAEIADLLSAHPKTRERIAFKGGAVMHIVDGSPRLSHDLDGTMVAGGRIREQDVRDVLGASEARRIIRNIDKTSSIDKDGMRLPFIRCRPMSGVGGDVTVSFSVRWDYPPIMKTEMVTRTIHGRTVSLRVMARVERAAEKVRAFVVRGLRRDAFDLCYYKTLGLKADEIARLGEILAVKMSQDSNTKPGDDLLLMFDEQVLKLAKDWDERRDLSMTRDIPRWAEIAPAVAYFRDFVPRLRPPDYGKQ